MPRSNTDALLRDCPEHKNAQSIRAPLAKPQRRSPGAVESGAVPVRLLGGSRSVEPWGCGGHHRGSHPLLEDVQSGLHELG
jgi:hypothetical protein